jgi:hypothetical protein
MASVLECEITPQTLRSMLFVPLPYSLRRALCDGPNRDR